jgi:hypothetical protein
VSFSSEPSDFKSIKRVWAGGLTLSIRRSAANRSPARFGARLISERPASDRAGRSSHDRLASRSNNLNPLAQPAAIPL